MPEKNKKRCVFLCTSYPSGNQVDVSPLVAILPFGGSIPGHLLWRVGFVSSFALVEGQSLSGSFPAVARAPGHRGHSGFSEWFTYEWVARVSWQGRGGLSSVD